MTKHIDLSTVPAAIAPAGYWESGTLYPAALQMASTGRSGSMIVTLAEGCRIKAIISQQHGAIWTAFKAAALDGKTSEVDHELMTAILNDGKEVKERKERKERKAPTAKPWDGITLEGRGWTIRFDQEIGKTRLMFSRYPGRAAVEAAKEAGFCWNAAEGEWRRGYKKSSFDAASKLAEQLPRLVG